MNSRSRLLQWSMPALLAVTLQAGCSGRIEENYGRMRGRSINGTGVLASLLKARGHEVKTAVRLTESLKEWADVIVRFSPHSGTIGKDEAAWYSDWFLYGDDRRLLYVPRDYDGYEDYWDLVNSQLPYDASARLHERVDEVRSTTQLRNRMPGPPQPHPANKDRWFDVDTAKPTAVAKTLGGPWSRGLDPSAVKLPQHEVLKLNPKDEARNILLTADGKPFIVEWEESHSGFVLLAGNGSFLLNIGLAHPAKRPLAEWVVDWLARLPDDDELSTKRIAFVEGPYVTGDAARQPSVFHLLEVAPFGWISAQVFVLALAACLMKAPRLGRPKPDEPSGAERPAAHPEALGTLLSKTGQAGQARSMLEAYRRWRMPQGSASTVSKST